MMSHARLALRAVDRLTAMLFGAPGGKKRDDEDDDDDDLPRPNATASLVTGLALGAALAS